jgi:iron complex transport system substrate-binding protein
MRNVTIVFFVFIFPFSLISCDRKPQNDASNSDSGTFKIVSLTPSITKQLNLLGVQDNVFGHTSYCPSENLENSEVVATGMEVNVEKIVTLEPDVVLVSTLTNEKVIENLKKFDMEVKYLPMPKSFDEICEQFIEIGEIVRSEKKAKTIVKRQRAKLDSLQNLIPEGEKLKFFIEIGANPLFAATSESFMHDYIRYANGVNITEDLKNGYVNRENILVKNPDVIIIVTTGVAGKKEQQIWQEYPNLNAAKKDNIFVIDADKASSPTPASFVSVEERIIQLVYSIE